MSYSWETRTSNIEKFVLTLQAEINEICNHNIIGIYLHGSLAMGGFNPNRSDIDLILVTKEPISRKTKRRLAQLFLSHSNSPFPIEISVLNMSQLHNWQHPCPFDFHFSEHWRERYKDDINRATGEFINDSINLDPDLAAYIMIINHRGICLEGKPIVEVFPSVPKSDYLSSIMEDFEDCLVGIVDNPIYCSLNLLRVYWYLKEGVISSKQEAGEWGLHILPPKLKSIIQNIVNDYSGKSDTSKIDKKGLLCLRDYILSEMKKIDSKNRLNINGEYIWDT
ncbi:aminoglycoside adenylyltransferase domain-containing protein [Paucisalibacillus sp. EB02]|uniref:aminoglycoside adenylyltransferase domain-containing protein n=1 Tax=Paucisalibacillus sp. EB02 TaxID=1347087 RepID=UPI0004AD8E51|nr:aminoglycoside adenylyltransferase domain-containing protein [Paucisalibacillus sp. EB02]